jgi:hypothetical protein
VHPEASGLWDKLAARDRGAPAPALIDQTSCRTYAEAARQRLELRLQQEAKGLFGN